MKRKYLILLLCIPFVLLLSSCGTKTDSTKIDEQLSSLIKNMGEEEISLDETRNKDFIVSEELDLQEGEEAEEIKLDENGNSVKTYVPWEDIETELDDPDLLTYTERLPQIDGYKFGMISLAEEAPFPEEEIEYLGLKWMPIKVRCPRDSYGDSCSLYLSNIWDFENKDASVLNEQYLNLLSNTIEYFGEPIFSYKSEIVDLNDLTSDDPIAYLFKTPKYYLVCYFQVNPAKTGILVNYYFMSTEIPHTEKNEKALLNFIREHDPNFNIKVYYETSEGNFVL